MERRPYYSLENTVEHIPDDVPCTKEVQTAITKAKTVLREKMPEILELVSQKDTLVILYEEGAKGLQFDFAKGLFYEFEIVEINGQRYGKATENLTIIKSPSYEKDMKKEEFL